MRESAKRLLEAGLARGYQDFTAIARALGASDQSATNWKARGVPSRVIVRAAALFGVDAAWLAVERGATAPKIVGGTPPSDHGTQANKPHARSIDRPNMFDDVLEALKAMPEDHANKWRYAVLQAAAELRIAASRGADTSDHSRQRHRPPKASSA